MGTRVGWGRKRESRGGWRSESLGIYEVVIEVDRNTRQGGRRQRETFNHNRKSRHLSETVASCGGPESRNGRRGTGSGRTEGRRRARNPRRVVDAMCDVQHGGDIGGKRKKRRQESVGSVAVDLDSL